jgi:hypothetical protein
MPSQALRTAALASLVASLPGCAPMDPLGYEEPLRVERGTLVRGLATRSDANAPAITAFETPSTIVGHRQRFKQLTGRMSRDAFAVAIRLQSLGTGAWVLPAGAPDPTAGDELTFDASLSFAPALAPGLARLELRAVDSEGRAGPASLLPLCILGEIPDNANVCDPSVAPPIAVFSLSWDAPVDVDLELELPDGRRLSAKRPALGADARAPGGAFIDTDAGARCVPGARRESAVLQESPPLGRYRVYASLFDACGQGQAYVTATVHRRGLGAASGTFVQVQTARADAQLLAVHASGGLRPPTLVGEFSLP